MTATKKFDNVGHAKAIRDALITRLASNRKTLRNTRNMLIAAAAITMAQSSTAARAADPDVIIIGVGASRCEQWNKDHHDAGGDKALATGEEDWLSGFLSGFNAFSPHGMMPPDREARREFMNTFCREHPSENISVAATVLAMTALRDHPHRAK